MPRSCSSVARKSPPFSGEEMPRGTHRQSGSFAKVSVAYNIQKQEAFKGHYPGRRRTRNLGALLCALGLGILALVPLLGSLKPGASAGTTLQSRAASPATTSAKRGTGGSGRWPSGNERDRFLLPEEVAGDLVSDGRPRCFEDAAELRRCLPTVFFLGVSKCGTTSLSNWLAEHPRIRFAPPAEGHNFRETHLFDFSPKPWHGTKAPVRRAKLASVAEPRDTVVDFTPHYSLVAETPLRIADFYGEGLLRTHGLRFLVLLREPVARTISSWEYKSDPYDDILAAEAKPETQPHASPHERRLGRSKSGNSSNSGINSTLSKQEEQRLQGIERRTLQEIVLEGMERVNRLADCVANATESGLFGREPKVTYCRTTKGKKQCEGHPPCEICNSHTEPWCNPRSYLEDHMYNAHVGKSVYAMQLKRWFDVFGQENFKVIFTEDMAEDPFGTIKDVLDFLSLDVLDPQGETAILPNNYAPSACNECFAVLKGLRSEEEWAGVVGARYNMADREKKEKLDSQITPEVLRSMQDFFAPHNKALEDLLGVPLPSSWRAQASVPRGRG